MGGVASVVARVVMSLARCLEPDSANWNLWDAYLEWGRCHDPLRLDDIMSFATELGQTLLDHAIAYFGTRSPRVYYIPYAPSPDKATLLELSELISPEYLIILAFLGLIFCGILILLVIRVVLFGIHYCFTNTSRRVADRQNRRGSDELTDLARLLTPQITVSQIRAIQQQEQLRMLAALSGGSTTPASSLTANTPVVAPTPTPVTAESRGRPRSSRTRSTNTSAAPSRRITRSASMRSEVA